MKILVINGDCLQVNTSANLCHLAYIRGLVCADHRVDVLCADGRDYQLDSSMQLPEGVRCFTYYGVSRYEKLSLKKNRNASSAPPVATSPSSTTTKPGVLPQLVGKAKSAVLSLYGVHGIYATFVRKAKKFRSETHYDYVLSLSTPVTSHLLTHKLLKKGNIQADHWIQIWEDPWYTDAYGFNGKKKIFREERRLLSFAERVCYVSPLTLRNQQRLFPESAHKMYWQPLPYYYKDESPVAVPVRPTVYGYFGDYAPAARNLEPFYEAAKKTGITVNICGRPSNLFPSTGRIHIHPRLPLDQLKPLEDKTNVLVFLCNRKGGQIPGKIYQYSATEKTILFIMDGTEEEQKVLYDFFSPFNRYVFCENTVESITAAIEKIESGNLGDVQNKPLEAFNPQETIRKILNG